MKRQLSDGSIVSGYDEHVMRAAQIDRDMRAKERLWVVSLRSMGVRAAHPDDGWVNRQENKVHLCYPQFNDGLRVGDLLALGWPHQTRIVRITGTSSIRLAVEPGPWYWHFEATS